MNLHPLPRLKSGPRTDVDVQRRRLPKSLRRRDDDLVARSDSRFLVLPTLGDVRRRMTPVHSRPPSSTLPRRSRRQTSRPDGRCPRGPPRRAPRAPAGLAFQGLPALRGTTRTPRVEVDPLSCPPLPRGLRTRVKSLHTPLLLHARFDDLDFVFVLREDARVSAVARNDAAAWRSRPSAPTRGGGRPGRGPNRGACSRGPPHGRLDPRLRLPHPPQEAREGKGSEGEERGGVLPPLRPLGLGRVAGHGVRRAGPPVAHRCRRRVVGPRRAPVATGGLSASRVRRRGPPLAGQGRGGSRPHPDRDGTKREANLGEDGHSPYHGTSPVENGVERTDREVLVCRTWVPVPPPSSEDYRDPGSDGRPPVGASPVRRVTGSSPEGSRRRYEVR